MCIGLLFTFICIDMTNPVLCGYFLAVERFTNVNKKDRLMDNERRNP